jgi:T5SS/PEP-CTERM-associated repeat protein
MNTGATGMVTVDGVGSTWTGGNYLYVGNSGTGVLAVTNGGKVSNTYGYLGYSGDSAGTATVDGTGSTWTNSYALMVGGAGTGTLTITHGGQVSDAIGNLGAGTGSTGTVTVDGTGSTWTNSGTLIIGYQGTGVLAVTNGGKVDSTGYYGGVLGYKEGARGTVLVDGAGSMWITSLLTVGSSGAGTLAITNGGQVSSTDGALGLGWIRTSAVGLVTVTGSGSMWTNSGSLTVGKYDKGSLTISNGGRVSNTYGFLGYSTGATGMVTIDGIGSTWTCAGGLFVGNAGAGTLAIANGGLVTVSGTTYIAGDRAGVGTIAFGVNGGTLTTRSLFAVPSQFTGTGMINTRGLCGDGELVFDGTHGLTRTLVWNGDNENVTVHLDMTGASGTVGALGAGYQGAGTLTIQGGVTVPSNGGFLGYKSGATGLATITGTGSTWASSGSLTVGQSGTGTLAITNGGKVSDTYGYLGYSGGAMGTGMVDGATSIWTSSTLLTVGQSGMGTLAITNGGKVNTGSGCLGYNGGSTGVATVDGTSSTWINTYRLWIGYTGMGTLAITHGGQVSNTDPNNGVGYLGYDKTGAGIVTVDGTGSTWTSAWDINTGYSGAGTLTITNGGKVSNRTGYLGVNAGGTGAIRVDGTGSSWAIWLSAYVGFTGTGTLTITHGGQVNDTYGYIGNNAGSTGMVTVDGAGSTWANSGSLTVGNLGTGTLAIANGGKVTAVGMSINSASTVAMKVGDGSSLSAGSGTLTNNGVVRLMTAAGATAGTYTPVTATKWAGTGTVQALGGKWDTSSHVFTVSAAAAGAAGLGVTVDRAVTQRVVITDATSGEGVVVGFMGTSGSAPVTLTGWELTPEQEAALVGVVPSGQQVLEGWTFAAEGYTAGEPVGLAFNVGNGFDPGTLAVWHYDGAEWTAFTTYDLTYDGTYASFTVTGFSGYAVTGAVPEASTLGVLALGVVGMLGRRRRKTED